ncbi:MAG: AI-2E family transporter [Bacteroidia bacterium]|jgi:predicted PurR-regulated permease PerM|nr:AI-2E family transporter [Bacteroidia bacterium]
MIEKNLLAPFKISIVLVGIFTLVSMLSIMQEILLPLLFSFILAIVLYPFVNLLHKHGLNRVLAIVVTLLLITVISTAILLLLASQASLFASSFPALLDNLVALLDQTKDWIAKQFNINNQQMNSWIDTGKEDILLASKRLIGPTLMNFGGLLVWVVLIPVYLFMILYYKPLLISFIYQLFSSENNKSIKEVLVATQRIIQSYLVGLLVESAMVTGLNIGGLLLLGIDYAILLGLIGGLINAIPYVGGIMAMLLPLLIALATKPPIYAIMVILMYVFIQFIDNNIIMPYIVSSKVEINGLISIIVVLLGGALWGIGGMFLSIPITAILKVILDHLPGYNAWGFLLGSSQNQTKKIKL